MWMIATEDLKEFLPENGRNGGKTNLDVSEQGVPRLFTNRTSAAIALGHWFNGPYVGVCDYEDAGGWYYDIDTDPARRLVWGDRLGVRKVKVISDE